jgi:hypothetical protein
MHTPFLSRILTSQMILPFLITSVLAQSPGSVNFVFQKLDDDHWQGSCVVQTAIFQTATFTLSSTKSIISGSWRKDISPTTTWAGIEVDSGYVDSTIPVAGVLTPTQIKVANGYVDSTVEMEIYAGGFGVLRIQDGWYAISSFSQSPQNMRFQVDTSQEVPPSELDRDIIKRAGAILSTDSLWNRADDRECGLPATRWSIYCAMVQATIDVTGGFHHRRPALQLIRRIVEERTVGRKYRHRLMDYNNDPSTRFEDVTSIFLEGLARIHK